MLACVGAIGYLCGQAGRGSQAQAGGSTTRLPAGRLPPMWRLAFERDVCAVFLFSLEHCCRRFRAFTASRTCSSTPQSAEPPAASSGEELCAVPCRSAEQLFWGPGRQEVLRHLLRSGVWTINLARPEARLFRGVLSLLPALLLGAKGPISRPSENSTRTVNSGDSSPQPVRSPALFFCKKRKPPGPCGAPGPPRVPGGRC